MKDLLIEMENNGSLEIYDQFIDDSYFFDKWMMENHRIDNDTQELYNIVEFA